MFKPKDIAFSDLPIEKIGYEKGSGAEIYKLISELDADIRFSLDAHGFKRKGEAVLVSGEVVYEIWTMRA